MATDTLTLGPFVFDDWSTPAHLPGGGAQQMIVHKMPGGIRVIDCMGPDDEDRAWRGFFFNEGAIDDALTLDALRIAGSPLMLTNASESRLVVISRFHFDIVKVQFVEYEICVTPVTGGGGGGGGASLDVLIGSDIGAAISLSF